MESILATVVAHVGHWFEAAMFAPAAVLVVTLSIKSILERRNRTQMEEENL